MAHVISIHVSVYLPPPPLCVCVCLCVLLGNGTEGGDALTMLHYCFLCTHQALHQGFHPGAHSEAANICCPFLQKGPCRVLTWICWGALSAVCAQCVYLGVWPY